MDTYAIGTYRDVFCNKNLIFYEAMVVKHKIPKRGKDMDKVIILFHFKGWSSKFDEWIEAGSDRIKMHNLHTDPTSSDPRDQEKWQGRFFICVYLYIYIVVGTFFIVVLIIIVILTLIINNHYFE